MTVVVSLGVVVVVFGFVFDLRHWLASRGDDSARGHAPAQAPPLWRPVPATPDPAPVFAVSEAPPVLPRTSPPPVPTDVAAPALGVPTAPPLRGTVAAPVPSAGPPPRGAPLLECRGVHVAYDKVRVLFGVDMEIRQGEIVALLGTNGAGKSTLLKAVSGLVEPIAGSIVFDGRDITHADP
ncbi:MAG TPA: ATP-binding cassette domain-containing protein, partial [Acidimicrobiales bacterium]|nr:ATP-binding cassette domain-containing protein [Acidimicrobiales bacterium]